MRHQGFGIMSDESSTVDHQWAVAWSGRRGRPQRWRGAGWAGARGRGTGSAGRRRGAATAHGAGCRRGADGGRRGNANVGGVLIGGVGTTLWGRESEVLGRMNGGGTGVGATRRIRICSPPRITLTSLGETPIDRSESPPGRHPGRRSGQESLTDQKRPAATSLWREGYILARSNHTER